ncbi:hypothetical protein DL93DRAFT_2227575 [Clavulina sp. PMI_390]|nr:hypothetical protein DL93DRAFT_2227575 [Clavulina sp. PMI_390]
MKALLKLVSPQMCTVALVAPTTRPQRLLVFFVILALETWNMTVLIYEPGMKGGLAYTEACGIVNFVMVALQLLVATGDPRISITWGRPAAHNSRRKRKAESGRLYLSSSALSFYSRVWWTNWLMLNPRGIGTNAQAANITPLPQSLSSSIGSFCRSRFISAVKGLLILVSIGIAPAHSQFVLEAATTSSPTVLQRAALTTCGVVFAWNLLNVGQCLLACLAVGLRVSEPEDWPDMFGAVTDAYTLRRAWGRSWHQVLRKPFEFAGNSVARLFGAKPHTFASKYLKLYSAFALSTLVHMWGDVALRRNTPLSHMDSSNVPTKSSLEGLFSPQFFFSHAVGIMLEDHIIDAIRAAWTLGRSEGSREEYPPALARLGRIIGYAWVFLWLCATYPQFQHGVLRWTFVDITSSI